MQSHIHTAFKVTSVTVLAVLGLYLYKKKKRNNVPKIWEPVGKISALYLYPLKSGRRLDYQKLECTSVGVKECTENENVHQFLDRSLVIYSRQHKEYKTARTYPKMVLIETSLHDQDHFAFNAPGMDALYVKIPKVNEVNDLNEDITLLSVKTKVVDCGDEAAAWFSRYILEKDSGARLGFHDGTHRRDITKKYERDMTVFKNLTNEATGLYTDLSSYHIINQSSVDDLCKRTGDAGINAEQFRPNIIVEGAEAYAEDSWDWIKIGDVILYMAKPCTRCVHTVINPDTGVRDAQREPLKTLEKYRQIKDLYPITWDEKTGVMGLNMGLIKSGIVNVGDTVYVGKF